ncbi:hypothetical protein B0A53_06055 [Rhodotorula sp. CCFEE 5036]|nr:hypothetical protein B0A53_06055 [Rhodotorula sp. CCFEE 5036]
MVDSTDPLDGDLGLRLTCSPPEEQEGEPWAPPSASASPPTSDPHPQLTQTTRGDSVAAAALDSDTLARLGRTVVTFALVDFDIDAGPTLRDTCPPQSFPPGIQQNIAFSSLPEGAAALSDDSAAGYAYSWRIPLTDNDATGTSALYGYTWFVREHDSRLRRGYAQKSLVLITHLASLSGLFSALMEILGPLHFKHAAQQQQQQRRGGEGAGEEGSATMATRMGGMVETACRNIASWPDLTPGTTLELPFLGSVLTVAIPLSPHQVQLPPSSSSSHLTGTRSRTSKLPYTDPPSPFLSHQAWSASSDRVGGGGGGEGIDFSTLVTLWELLLLGEPILVWSGDPRTGSETVEGLKALIKPIPFAGDDRPYFHVHDVDFARLCKPGTKQPEQGLLIASTNPLLLTTCKHWPHILRLDRTVPSLPPSSSSPTTLSSLAAPARSPLNGVPSSAARTSGSLFRSSSTHQQQQQQQQQQQHPQRSASTGSRFAGVARRQGSDGATHTDIPLMNKNFGLKTTRKRHVKKDEAVKKEIETLWQRGDYTACDSAIYRYFASLTEQFLAPLNRYFGTLWAGNEVVARTTPLLSPGPRPAPSTRFSASAFLASLRTHGSSLSFRSSAPSLSQPGTSPLDRFYLRFIEHSPHFQRWLEDRIVATGGEVRKRYVKQLENVDLEDWAREKQMREVDEMVGTFEREVGRLESPGNNDPSASASPRVTAHTSVDTSTSPHPPSSAALGDTFTATGSPTANGPAAKLRAQASRLRLIRDEKARSLSREREAEHEPDHHRLSGGGGGGLARKGSGTRSIDTV